MIYNYEKVLYLEGGISVIGQGSFILMIRVFLVRVVLRNGKKEVYVQYQYVLDFPKIFNNRSTNITAFCAIQ